MKFNMLFITIACSGLILFACEKGKPVAEESEEKERAIAAADLPEAVSKDISTRYPGAAIKEADEITHNDKSITYDVELSQEGKVFEAMYKADGTFIGLESDDEDKEGDKDGAEDK